MKLALITDTHYGVRGDHQAFLDNNKKFLDETFFPYLKEHNIKTIIHLGDLLDRRKYINYQTAARLRKDFFEPLHNMKIDFRWILGNHDIYYRNTNEVSAASELIGESLNPYMRWYDAPIEQFFDNTKILFVPWICESNKEQTESLLKTTDAQVILGHLELAGFEMYKGQINHNGDTLELYRRFPMVCTGHFHHKSSVENIHYLGAHAEFTWSDYDDPRGFHIFDTKTLKLEFVPNPFRMFEKVYYDDAGQNFKGVHFADLTGKIVKLIVKSQTDTERFNWFVSQIEMAQPLELTIVQDHLNLEYVSDETIVSETKDTLTLMREFVQQTNNVVNMKKLDSLVTELYHKAINLE